MTTPPPADNNPAGDDAPTDQDQEVRKAASGGAKTFVVTIAAKALTLVFRGLLTNLYGAAAYGLFAFALVIVNMLGLLSTLGLDRAMLRFGAAHGLDPDGRARFDALLRFCVRLTFALSAAAALVVITLAPNISAAFDKPGLEYILQLFAVALPIVGVSNVVLMALQARQLAGRLALIKHLAPLGALYGGLAVAIALGTGLPTVVLAQMLGWAVVVVAGLAILRPRRTTATPVAVPYQAILAFSLSMIAYVGIRPLILNLDRLVIGWLRPVADVGVYDIAATLSLQSSIILGSLNAIIFPQLGALHAKGDHQAMSRLFQTVTRWVLQLTAPLTFSVILLRAELMSWFGPEFILGASSLAVLSLAQFIHSIAGPVGGTLMMTGHERWLLVNTVLMATTNAALNVLLVGEYGIVGAAWATLAAVLVWNVSSMIELYHFHRLIPYTPTHLRYIALAALLYLPLEALTAWLDHRLAAWAAAIAFAALYGGGVLLIGLEDEDKKLLQTIRRKLTGGRL